MAGLASLLPELEAKSFQLLAELVPRLTRVAVLLNPDNPLHEVKDAEAAAKLMGLQLVTVQARTPEEFPAAFDTIAKAHAGAVDIWGDPVFSRHRAVLIDLATKSRLPTMFKTRPDVVAGGLIGYGPDFVEKSTAGRKPPYAEEEDLVICLFCIQRLLGFWMHAKEG